MPSPLFVLPWQQPLSDSLSAQGGAKLYAWAAGTTTPKNTYQDNARTVAHTNPVVADVYGRFAPIFLDPDNGDYKFELRTSTDIVVKTLDNYPANPASAGAETVGAALFPRTDEEIAAGVTPTYYRYQPGDIRRYGAMSGGVIDNAAAFQSACNASKYVYIPGGRWKYTTAPTVTREHLIQGAGKIYSVLEPWGCHGFSIPGLSGGVNGTGVTIADLRLNSYSALGAGDPRTHYAVNCSGTSTNTVNYFTGRDLFVQGFDRAFSWDYTSDSNLHNVSVVNCNNGLRLFGQCVNNTLAESRIVVNNGTSAIETVKDGTTQGEGLMVSDTLLAGDLAAGTTYGVYSDGFLSMTFSNCVVDLFRENAFDLTDVRGFAFEGGWVYSNKRCFSFNALGSAADIGAAIRGYFTTVSANQHVVFFGANNRGLSWQGGQAISGASGTGRVGYFDGSAVRVDGVNVVNTTGNASFYVNATDVHIGSNMGDNSATFNVSQVPTTASAATVTLPRRAAVHSISGTTNIDTITATGWDAQDIVLIFQDALTVNDGAGNLQLAGNFTTTANDTLRLVCSGSTWYEIGRSAN